MALQIDWGRLVATGRVKSPGVEWTPEELKAIQNGIDPEEVRAGNLTPEDVVPNEERPLSKMTKSMLVAKAEALGIKTISDYDAVTRADLIEEIKKVEKHLPVAKAKKVKIDTAVKTALSDDLAADQKVDSIG